MPTAPVRPRSIREAADRVEEHVRAGARRVHVRAAPGTGRSSVSRLLDAEVLEVLSPWHPDVVGDALLQVMRLVGDAAQPAGTLAERLEWMQQVLSRRGGRVVVRLHADWARLSTEPAAGRSGFHDHAGRWLDALLAPETEAEVVVVGGLRGRTLAHVVWMPQARVDWGNLGVGAEWPASYREAAAALRRACGDVAAASPLVARLAIGRCALGQPAEAVAREVGRSSQRPSNHVAALVQQIRDGVPVLLPPLRRLVELRRPLAADAALGALAYPVHGPHSPLFTAVLGYEQPDGRVRWSELVLDALRQQLRDMGGASTSAHLELAAAWETVDGVTDPVETASLSTLRFWSEKVHHLAHGGEPGAARWAAQQVVQPEQLWDRGRALSEAGRYDEAAALFERCIAQDAHDAYAWHYLGFNLDRAGRNRARAAEAYDQAVALDPANPWWNARRITWLVGQARYADAEDAWEEALGHIDPAGTREEGWLVGQFHAHVVRAWLTAGELSRARRAFDAIPEPVRSEARELEQWLVDAEEAFALQGAVRPYGLLGEARWTPAALPSSMDDGTPLVRWYAGFIVATGEDGVHVRAATPPEHRVLVATLPWADWSRWGGSTIRTELANRYFELGEYGDAPVVVVRLLNRQRRPIDEPQGRAWVDAWLDR